MWKEVLKEAREIIREKVCAYREEVRESVENVLDTVQQWAEKYGAEVLLGGSYGKDTWIPESFDIDVFFVFDKKENMTAFCSANLEGMQKMKGSRPYFKGKISGIEVEIVPIKKISKPEEAETSTDLSQFHIDYVNRSLDDKQKIDVRLLKYLCKNIGVYGAEAYIGGFSGYVLEVLTAYYGSADSLFESVENEWRPKMLIDPTGTYKDWRDAVTAMGKDKTRGPLIVVDPTWNLRNAAAAVEMESFCKFIFAVRKFIRDPDITLVTEIVKKDISDVVTLAEKRDHPIFIAYIPIKGKKDEFLGKLKRVQKRIVERLKRAGIVCYTYGMFPEEERVLMYFEIWSAPLGKVERHLGPPVWTSKEHFDKFYNKWREVYVYGTRMVADKHREPLEIVLKKMIEEYGVQVDAIECRGSEAEV